MLPIHFSNNFKNDFPLYLFIPKSISVVQEMKYSDQLLPELGGVVSPYQQHGLA